MKEIKEDLFKMMRQDDVDAICITTNCSISDDGTNPMGGGCAGVARKMFPEIDLWYGNQLSFAGHVPMVLGYYQRELDQFIFPTQVENDYPEDGWCWVIAYPTMHSVFESASLSLIVRSAQLLVELVNTHKLDSIIVPRMGSGIGGLDWANVREAVKDILDDRFTIVSFEHEK